MGSEWPKPREWRLGGQLPAAPGASRQLPPLGPGGPGPALEPSPAGAGAGAGLMPGRWTGGAGPSGPCRWRGRSHSARPGAAPDTDTGTARGGPGRSAAARTEIPRLGTAGHDTARHGSVRFGTALQNLVRLGCTQFGTARFGSVRHGSVRHPGDTARGCALRGRGASGVSRVRGPGGRSVSVPCPAGSAAGAGSARVPREAEPGGPGGVLDAVLGLHRTPKSVGCGPSCGLQRPVEAQGFHEDRTCSWKREDGWRDVGREGWRRWKG